MSGFLNARLGRLDFTLKTVKDCKSFLRRCWKWIEFCFGGAGEERREYGLVLI